jgi:phospholipid/cholesterol/gamma-HCH transport system permease protein
LKSCVNRLVAIDPPAKVFQRLNPLGRRLAQPIVHILGVGLIQRRELENGLVEPIVDHFDCSIVSPNSPDAQLGQIERLFFPMPPAIRCAAMPVRKVELLGRNVNNAIAGFGDFSVFAGKTFRWFWAGGLRWKNLRNLMPQLYEVGVMSVPVVSVVGAFIGMVMAVETYSQFKAFGQESRLSEVIILSVVKQIGPVMASVMLAGRVGGAITAELGTMNVTEQLDALRVMGADPIRYLVLPRFLACVLLTPILTIYSDIMGILGGWLVAVRFLNVPSAPFWHYAQVSVDMLQIYEGLIGSIFFGAAIGLISCYKGFNCGSGASGVGRACTESFVISFLSIIIMNFIFADMFKGWEQVIYGATNPFRS